MRLLHLVDRLDGRGGAYAHLRAVLAAQMAEGHDVRLLAGSGGPDASWPCATALCAGLDARTRAPVALDVAWRDFGPDLVHVHTVVNPDALEWAAAQGAVATVQDHRPFCPFRGKWTRGGEPCRTAIDPLACADCFEDGAYFEEVWSLTTARLRALARMEVTVLSRYMRGELVAAGLDSSRVHVVPPFVDGLDLGAAADGPPCVLFAGRLAEPKGVRDAVAAWRRSGLDLPLVMAGTGPLREWAEGAGAEVLGWVDHARMAPLYRRAAALVLPSRWQEPFGIAGLEALSLGTPVVAWRSGGVEEWHPGGSALVEWGDVDALAAALVAWAGRRVAPPTRFGRESAMRALAEAYDRALAGRAA